MMVIHGFRNQQNAPAKNYNCNARLEQWRAISISVDWKGTPTVLSSHHHLKNAGELRCSFDCRDDPGFPIIGRIPISRRDLATSLASDGGRDRRVTSSPVTFASKMASTENRRRHRRVRPPTFVVRRMSLISRVSTVTLLSPLTWHNSAWVKIPA
jgi:hypothetical protein